MENFSDLKQEVLHLKHKPVFLLPYNQHDGPYAGGDCKFLSVGWAQWSEPHEPRSISVKALRKTDNRWSRQSEELPLHRAVDAVIFLASVVRFISNGEESVHFPPATFEEQPTDIRVLLEVGVAEAEAFKKQIVSDSEMNKPLRNRLNRLREILNAMHMERILS